MPHAYIKREPRVRHRGNCGEADARVAVRETRHDRTDLTIAAEDS